MLCAALVDAKEGVATDNGEFGRRSVEGGRARDGDGWTWLGNHADHKVRRSLLSERHRWRRSGRAALMRVRGGGFRADMIGG